MLAYWFFVVPDKGGSIPTSWLVPVYYLVGFSVILCSLLLWLYTLRLCAHVTPWPVMWYVKFALWTLVATLRAPDMLVPNGTSEVGLPAGVLVCCCCLCLARLGHWCDSTYVPYPLTCCFWLLILYSICWYWFSWALWNLSIFYWTANWVWLIELPVGFKLIKNITVLGSRNNLV
jgi:hypothetical protein